MKKEKQLLQQSVFMRYNFRKLNGNRSNFWIEENNLLSLYDTLPKK